MVLCYTPVSNRQAAEVQLNLKFMDYDEEYPVLKRWLLTLHELDKYDLDMATIMMI
jgi:hypothetical protein